MTGPHVRRALPDERLDLEALQRRASMALSEYREQLEAHPDAIHLAPEQIEFGDVLVAEANGKILGFAVLEISEGRAELDGLFVEPEHWRKRIGSALVEAVIREARRKGLTVLTVVASPSARAFYERCGFTVEDATETRFGPAWTMSR